MDEEFHFPFVILHCPRARLSRPLINIERFPGQ
jgi:hypothetical protein